MSNERFVYTVHELPGRIFTTESAAKRAVQQELDRIQLTVSDYTYSERGDCFKAFCEGRLSQFPVTIVEFRLEATGRELGWPLEEGL